VAVPAAVPVAVNVWAMVDPEDAVAPETPDCTTVQAKVVPANVLVRAMDGAVPEQIVWDPGVAVATGVGFTVTITDSGVPAHPLAVGVMVYVAVPAVVPVVLSVCAMVEPEVDVAPETPD
jgi:hypothetical protein